MKNVKVLISGYIGFDNYGDESILSVLLSNLKQQLTDITVISSNPAKTKLIHGVKTVKTFDLFNIFKTMLSTDIFISGGGSLLQDKTSLKSLFYYLFLILSAKLLNKKVVVFAQGIGPINNKFARFVTKYILKFSSFLTSVRDEKSLLLLRGWGLDVEMQPDPVFNLSVPQYLPNGSVGVQLRDWKFLTDDFLDVLADTILSQFSGRKICLFSLQQSMDYEICKNFAEKLKLKNSNVETELITSNIDKKLANLEYFIAMRFHACLTAIKLGVKTLAINYDEKVEKLAKEAGIPYVNLDEKDSICSKLEELKGLNSEDLITFALNKKYDFSKINGLINSYNPIRKE